jgi:hypothetical protein
LPGETTTVPPPTTPTGQVIALTLDAPAIPPGSDDAAKGTGCAPNVTVTFTIDGKKVGSTTSDDAGKFSAPLDVQDLAVGRYLVTAQCDRVLTTNLDVVLSSQLAPATGTLAVLIFLLLIGGLAVRWQIAGDFRRTDAREANGENQD